jgi:hypothetical protein
VEEGRDKRSDCKSAIKDPSRLRVPAEQPPHTHHSVRVFSQLMCPEFVLANDRCSYSTACTQNNAKHQRQLFFAPCYAVEPKPPHVRRRHERRRRRLRCVHKPLQIEAADVHRKCNAQHPCSATTVQFVLFKSFECSLRLSRACVGKSSCFTASKSPTFKVRNLRNLSKTGCFAPAVTANDLAKHANR